jgi:glycyl-tRNA synthetase beta chain
MLNCRARIRLFRQPSKITGSRRGPTDRVPTDPVAIAVALADKLDTLVGFWAIDEKPTGSKDPLCAARAALGVIRIVLERGIKVALFNQLKINFVLVDKQQVEMDRREKEKQDGDHTQAYGVVGDGLTRQRDLLAFFHDRLKVYLRDQGARHDLIDAVITPDADDLLMIARKVEALSAYINTEEGQNLVAGTKRAVNILNAEEKKGVVVEHVIDTRLFKEPAETALFEAMNVATNEAGNLIEREDFAGAMMALSKLRGPVDGFLDGVLVNDPNAAVKANRLALLGEIRKATQRVADFSKISG